MKTNILFTLLLVFSFQGYSQLNVTIGNKNEIVYPVKPNETNDLSDLIALVPIFKDKKIIGMGEATHGTREFFNMKAKMFKFLVTHCGFRIFSIEAIYGGTLKVNDYVLYGKGDVLSAMKSMQFWTWDTEEVKDLIEWMRIYNYGKADNAKLKFYGFDCQSFKGPADALMDYVKEFDENHVDEFSRGISNLNDSIDHFYYPPSSISATSQYYTQVHGIISFLQAWFTGKEKAYLSSSGRMKFELARRNIEILKQAVHLREIYLRESPGENDDESSNYRDSCMAENIKWIYGLEHAKIFSWAHNGHVCKGPNLYQKHVVKMGMYLDKMFSGEYYTIGFVFKQGSFQCFDGASRKMQKFTLPDYKKNKLAGALSLAGPSDFFIDLTGSDNKLFRTKGYAYFIGGGFMQQFWERYSKPLIVKNQFDGLIFINTTTSAVAINRKFMH